MTKRLFSKGRIIKVILPAALILCICILAVPIVFFYKVSHVVPTAEPLNPSYYLLKSSDFRATSKDGTEIKGWWIAGDQGAAGIVLCHGYGMNRSDVLSLAAALHAKGFNILVFGQGGSSAPTRKTSTFGLKESGDMLTAIQFVLRSPECDSTRIGIWGVDVGAYSALRAPASVSGVRAIAADSPFDSPYDFMDLLIEEEYGLNNRMLQFGCRQILKLICIGTASPGGEQIPVESLSDCALLFITGENRNKLGRLTTTLYDRLPSKKEIITFETSRIHMMKGKEFQDYDSHVTDFFVQNLR